jgi:hypothetical protein
VANHTYKQKLTTDDIALLDEAFDAVWEMLEAAEGRGFDAAITLPGSLVDRVIQSVFAAHFAVTEGANDARLPDYHAAAVALGRKGGLRGGTARAAALTPERRAEIARGAAAKRWGKKP